MIHTVSGKKSREPLVLEDATVDRTLVSSMAKTTEPLANLAILPVSIETVRLPTSNSSLNLSRIFRPGTKIDGEGSGSEGEVWKLREPRGSLQKRQKQQKHGGSGRYKVKGVPSYWEEDSMRCVRREISP